MKANPATTTTSHEPTSPPPPPPPPPPPRRQPRAATSISTSPVHKTIASAANLANLLPTGTVIIFQTLTPSFSNKGICNASNKCLTASLIALCSIICFLSSFTDSFTDSGGKLCYGIATFKGLYVFNQDERNTTNEGEDEEEEDLSRFRMSLIDFVHAFVSLLVFMAFAFSDSDVENCFFGFGEGANRNVDAVVMNLPLAAGVFSSFFFIIFPTTRRGIGYADMPANFK